MNIEINHLTKKYGNITVFDDISLSIPDEKMTCIFGKSGCGKTTLLDIIGFLEPYQNGEILYNGKELGNKKEQQKMLRKDIGFIFQDYGLIENETVEQNLLLVDKIKKDKNREKHIKTVFEELQLEESMLKKKVHELSGGEQQRVTIAKIILKNPKLILADEPTASLDPENKQIVLEYLKSFAEYGKTVVVVSHDTNVIKYADYTIDLQKLKNN